MVKRHAFPARPSSLPISPAVQKRFDVPNWLTSAVLRPGTVRTPNSGGLRFNRDTWF